MLRRTGGTAGLDLQRGPELGGATPAVSDNVDFSPWVTNGCGGTTLSPNTTIVVEMTDDLFCVGENTTIDGS